MQEENFKRRLQDLLDEAPRIDEQQKYLSFQLYVLSIFGRRLRFLVPRFPDRELGGGGLQGGCKPPLGQTGGLD